MVFVQNWPACLAAISADSTGAENTVIGARVAARRVERRILYFLVGCCLDCGRVRNVRWKGIGCSSYMMTTRNADIYTPEPRAGNDPPRTCPGGLTAIDNAMSPRYLICIVFILRVKLEHTGQEPHCYRTGVDHLFGQLPFNRGHDFPISRLPC